MEYHLHEKLIREFGGSTSLARHLQNVTASQVNNWRHRGIAWRYRPAVMVMLRERGNLLFEWAKFLEEE
jgi:hypothetical protein